MTRHVVYEWDYETVDTESGDIIDHNHATQLADYSVSDITDTLVLIRDSGNENKGVEDRSWAYVVNNQLPEYFSDASGNHTYKVPVKFHRELSKYLNNQ